MNKKSIFLIVAVVLIVAIGGIFFFGKKKNIEKSDLNKGSEVIEDLQKKEGISVVPTSEKIDFSDWKTYADYKYKFEFRYPNDWKIEKNSGVNYDRSVVSILSPKTFEMLQKPDYCEGCGPDISFYYYPSIADEPANKDIKAKTLDEFLEKEPLTKKIGVRKVGGIEMKEVIQGGLGVYYVLFGEKNGSIYKIFFTYKDSREAVSETENSIISTFKIR